MASRTLKKHLIHNVESVEFIEDKLRLVVDAQVHQFPLDQISAKLAAATPIARQNVQVSPSGYGLHWEELDEDLSIDALLGISHAPCGKHVQAALTREPSAEYPSKASKNKKC